MPNRSSLVRRYRRKGLSGEVHCIDAVDFLRRLPRESAHLVLLDPPFNLSKNYGKVSDSKPGGEYELWLATVIGEAIRVLIPGGALYLYHLPSWGIRMAALLERHLSFRHWIAIAMKNGFARGDRLYPAHYALLYFTKGEPGVFNRPRIQPAVCRSCGTHIKDYGGYKSIIEANGLNLSDVWDDLSPVRHRAAKSRSANELPSLLTDRVVEISGGEGLTFVDPFAGAGTGVLSAARHGMRFLACDIVRANCDLVVRRLESNQQTRG